MEETATTREVPGAAAGGLHLEPKPPGRAARPPADRSRETTEAGIPWLVFARHRRAVRGRWPTPWDTPIVTDILAPLARVTPETAVRSVLDVGATDRRREAEVRERWPGAGYSSLDIDRTNQHDYHDFAEVDRTFDVVLLLEVLEHLPRRDGMHLVGDCAACLRPGGWLIASVPNVLVPHYQNEFTHLTAINHLDLGALLQLNGLDVRAMARFATGSPRSRWIHRWLLGRWHRFMKTDFCQSMTCVARRPEGDP